MDMNNLSDATYTRFSSEELETGVYTLDDEVTIPNHQGNHRSPTVWCATNRRLLLLIFVGCLVFMSGIIAGYLIRRSVYNVSMTCEDDKETLMSPATTIYPSLENFLSDIKSKISVTLMQDYAYNKSGDGEHWAGSVWSQNQAKLIYSQWMSYGFETTYKTYTVTLSQPGNNTLEVHGLDGVSNVVSYKAKQNAFTPYSLMNSVTARPAFANYGRYEDYDVLKHGINKVDIATIVLVRSGKLPLGLMAKIAEENKDVNVIALVVYADPTDYAPEVNYDNPVTLTTTVFPKNKWLPQDVVVQDPILNSMGDPFTPGFASDGNHHQLNITQTSLTKIPVISIDYDTARDIFKGLTGAPIPSTIAVWGGTFGEYPAIAGSTQTVTFNVTVNNKLVQKEIKNVMGVIRGSVEPEKYVIIGAHRDSVQVGRASPGTGVTCLLEVARLLHFIVNNRNWKPYRSIMLVSWDGGSQGQMGSTEWIEEHLSLLKQNAVAYINLDDAVVGDYVFDPSGSPLLSKVIYEASKQVQCPKHGNMKVYEDWTQKATKTVDFKPRLSVPGVDSDDAPFLHLVGIPTMSLRYSYQKNMRIDNYPLYNTRLDGSTLVNMFDSKFQVHSAVVEVALRAVFDLASSPILPFAVDNYASVLLQNAIELKDEYPDINFDMLISAAQMFNDSAQAFTSYVDDAISGDNTDLLFEGINLKLLSVEKLFLQDIQRPYFSDYRHIMLAPTSQSAYKGEVFAALRDALNDKLNLSHLSGTHKRFLAATTSALQSASQLLSSDLL